MTHTYKYQFYFNYSIPFVYISDLHIKIDCMPKAASTRSLCDY